MITCPNCGTSNEDTAKFCIKCGESLVAGLPPKPRRRPAGILLAGGLLIGLVVVALAAGVAYYLLGPSLGPAAPVEGTPPIPPSATAVSPGATPVPQIVETPTLGFDPPALHPGEVARLGRGTIKDIAYSPDGRILAVGGSLGVWLYDADNLEPIRLVECPSPVSSVAFSPDGRLLASAGWDHTVRLWDVATGELSATLTGGIWGVSFSPDGRLLASPGWDESAEEPVVWLWNVSTRELRATLTGHTASVSTLRFSPDGRLLASGSGDETVRFWDVATGELQATLTGHTDSVRSVAFSPDGQLLASGSHDQTVRLWDVATGQPRATLTGHTESVWSVAFSPDGRLLASGSYDNTVRLWEVESLR